MNLDISGLNVDLKMEARQQSVPTSSNMGKLTAVRLITK